MAKLEKLCARGVFDPPGYSQIIKVTGAQSLLFLAGQVPYSAGGGVDHPGDFLAQARNVFGAVKAHVEAAGGTLNDVVKIVVYVTDRAHRRQAYPVIDEYFGELKPCSTGLIVSGLALPELVVEIDAYGLIDD